MSTGIAISMTEGLPLCEATSDGEGFGALARNARRTTGQWRCRICGWGDPSTRVLTLARLNSRNQTGIRSPLDEAILGAPHGVEESGYEKCDEIPYDGERRRLSAVLEHDSKRLLITKRTPEEIFERTRGRTEGQVAPFDGDARGRSPSLEFVPLSGAFLLSVAAATLTCLPSVQFAKGLLWRQAKSSSRGPKAHDRVNRPRARWMPAVAVQRVSYPFAGCRYVFARILLFQDQRDKSRVRTLGQFRKSAMKTQLLKSGSSKPVRGATRILGHTWHRWARQIRIKRPSLRAASASRPMCCNACAGAMVGTAYKGK